MINLDLALTEGLTEWCEENNFSLLMIETLLDRVSALRKGERWTFAANATTSRVLSLGPVVIIRLGEVFVKQVVEPTHGTHTAQRLLRYLDPATGGLR